MPMRTATPAKPLVIVFATIDVENVNALKPVAEEARARGYAVHKFYGEGMIFSSETIAEIKHTLSNADWLVVSISSNPEKAGIEGDLMSFAHLQGVKILIVSDIDGMMHRTRWCNGSAKYAHTITVTSPIEVEWARQYVGPKTRIIVAPNPSWISYFNVTKGRDEVRHLLGVLPDKKLIVFPCDKEAERNINRLIDLVKVTNRENMPLHIVVAIHPGADHSADVFGRIASYSKHPVTFSLQKETGVSTQEALSACDLAIMGNGTSLAYVGAGLGTPMVCIIDPLVDRKYWFNLSSQHIWAPVEMGITAYVEDRQMLWWFFEDFLDPESDLSVRVRQRQKELFQPAMFKNAAGDILALLEG